MHVATNVPNCQWIENQFVSFRHGRVLADCHQIQSASNFHKPAEVQRSSSRLAVLFILGFGYLQRSGGQNEYTFNRMIIVNFFLACKLQGSLELKHTEFKTAYSSIDSDTQATFFYMRSQFVAPPWLNPITPD